MLPPTSATEEPIDSHSQSRHHETPSRGGLLTSTSDPAWGPGPSQTLFAASPAASPTSPLVLDEFATDPGYLAYQEELRCLIFNTAQTAAPTREATPATEARGFGAPLSSAAPAPAPAATASTTTAAAHPDSAEATGANGLPPWEVKSGAGGGGGGDTETDPSLDVNAPGIPAPFSPALSSSLSSQDTAASQRHAAQVLAHPRRLAYLRNYVTAVAPWLDMFDSDRAFGIRVPVQARASASPALLYALLALSARQMERKEGKQHSFDSLELYQEAIRLLTPLLQARDPQVIVICTLLCCLEMMSASARDWRRHTEGCAALFDLFGVHGFSGGLLQAVFWCYTRMDLCGALISDGTESTLLHPSKWLPHGVTHDQARDLFYGSKSPDMHANYAVYLCSKVCELVADRTRFFELGDTSSPSSNDPDALNLRWENLWDDLQAWSSSRPPEMLPVQNVQSNANANNPFPQILYLHWAAISSNQLYHTACILLLGSTPRPAGPRLPGATGSAVWHAKQVCGISLTNPHQGCLNNAIQPLWVAGRLLSHRSEHALVVRLIRSIEAMTGWGTCWRIDDLESAWGYKVRRDAAAAVPAPATSTRV